MTVVNTKNNGKLIFAVGRSINDDTLGMQINLRAKQPYLYQ